MLRTTPRISVACAALLFVFSENPGYFAFAQDFVPTYKANPPAGVLTPNQVDTKLLGRLDYFDGMPSKATVEKANDFIVVSRGVEAFLSGMPAASLYAALEGFKRADMPPGVMGMTEELMDARMLFLTPNTTTIYGIVEIDVKAGPLVMVIPPGVLGPIQDAMFRFLSDVGLVGPDQGKGGKYLIVHKSYEGAIPEGYFVVRTPSYRNVAFFRAFAPGGDLASAARGVKEKFRMYPLSKADNPPEQKFVNLSGKKMNTIHANDFSYFEELNAVVQHEPEDTFEPQLTGILASIGIKKGQPFKPDARMKRLLTEAAAIGNAVARANAFAPTRKSVYYYPDRRWYSSFPGTYDFMNHGELVLDDRALWHFIATGVTPAMATPPVGQGSVYPCASRDSKGEYLDGGKNYSVTLPGPVPAKAFWSFTAYDGQTRSLLETDQRTAGLDSLSKNVKANQDGSFTIYFGPQVPQGHEGNWVQTAPNKSYFVFLRLYGPLEAWFDKSWKPGDFEQINN